MASVEILGTTEEKWPDKEVGPWALRLTTAIVDDRPAVVGVELYAVDPELIRQNAQGWPTLAAHLVPRVTERITTAGMRVPLAERLAAYLARTKKSDEIIANAAPDQIPARWREFARERLASIKHAESARRGRPPLYGREHFERVAAVYNEALRSGAMPPLGAVARAWTVSESTAAKWVSRCRRTFGLLPPTTPGRAAGWSVGVPTEEEES